MATINDNNLEFIKQLYYKKGFGVQKIADKLGVSIDAVFYFMRKNKLTRRSPSESNFIRYDKATPSFKLKELKSEKLRTLKAIGVMLYWGEGCKSDKMGVVDFANSDEGMIRLFMKFLREICGVKEEKLRAYLYIHANQDIGKCIKYWNTITGIEMKQFTKPYVRKDFDENKKGKMPYGLIHIRYSDKKLLKLIKKWIAEYSN